MPRYKIFIEVVADDEADAMVLGQAMAGSLADHHHASVEDCWKETDNHLERRLEFLRLGTVDGS